MKQGKGLCHKIVYLLNLEACIISEKVFKGHTRPLQVVYHSRGLIQGIASRWKVLDDIGINAV